MAPDFRQSALIVPGMNFGVLLTRSTQFRPFAEVIYPTYPDRIDQAVVNSLVQVLWDRGEANGYAWHMTRDPLPNTPTHRVLLHEAFGDHQVANIQTETEARVIGARLRTPALDPGRSIDRRPFYGIKRVRRYPWRGNGLVVFDIGPLRPAGCRPEAPTTCQGTPPPPITNIAPELGKDPHGITAFSGAAVSQFSSFLKAQWDVHQQLRLEALLRRRMDGAVRALRRAVRAIAVSAALVSAAPAAGAPPQDAGCDPIDPSRCLLPWPNDHFTVRDKSTPTGRRVNLRRELMPTQQGRRAHRARRTTTTPTGSAPAATIITKVPGLDTPEALERTGAVPLTDLAQDLRRGAQPIVVINAATGRRQLIWAELDSNASTARGPRAADPSGEEPPRGRALHRRAAPPARRRRRPAAAEPRVQAPAGTGPRTKAFKRRRHAHGGASSRRSSRAGIERDDLYLAWDFTVASARGLSGRLRHIRDDAFRALGDTDLDDLRVRGAPPGVHASTRSPTCAVRQRRVPGLGERRDPPPRGGHGRRAVLPGPARLPARVALPARAGRPSRAHARQRAQGQLHLQHPALGELRAAGAVSRSTATACSAARAR